MKTQDEDTVEELFERPLQDIPGFGAVACVSEHEWDAMQRYIRHLRDELYRSTAVWMRIENEAPVYSTVDVARAHTRGNTFVRVEVRGVRQLPCPQCRVTDGHHKMDCSQPYKE